MPHVKQRPTKPTKQAITARQGVNSKPVGAKEAYELRRHFHHTGGIQKQHLPQPIKWRSKKNGKAARLRTLRLAGELDSHGYRHNPEHTGKRLALFPFLNQPRGARYCSRRFMRRNKRAFCARRFSRQTPVAPTGARALKKHGTGAYGLLWTATAVCLRLRYLYMYMVCCCAKTL